MRKEDNGYSFVLTWNGFYWQRIHLLLFKQTVLSGWSADLSVRLIDFIKEK